MAGDGGHGNSLFTKTICSICYEDLKPIVEDLQSISVCGHVFHELCLQQWFEYCPKGRKRSCPVCKQNCTNANVSRLYFQSVGDSNEILSQKPPEDSGEVHEELKNEVCRLAGKFKALASSFELQQNELKEVNHELVVTKEQLAIEVRLKNEALTHKASIQQLLRVKCEELEKSTSDCRRARENSMALAKELAAFKLASDLNLEEDEVMKLASLGRDAGSKETADVLRKSLIIRNRSYKELMTKCNTLGRGEARCIHKLEKANEKIKKLKLRVQELETAAEMKDNEALRVLKDQDCKFKANSPRNTLKRPANQASFDEAFEMRDNSFCSKSGEPVKRLKPTIERSTMDNIVPPSTSDQNDLEKGPILIHEDKDVLFSSARVTEFSNKRTTPCSVNSAVTKSCHALRQDATSDAQDAIKILKSGSQNGIMSSQEVSNGVEANTSSAGLDDEVICYGSVNPVDSSLNIRKETGLSAPLTNPGGNCFSGGLLGPDGTNWHLGKWCKKVPNSGSTNSTGELISVGADGRGGRIKVMRTLDRPLADIKNTPSLAKKSKTGAKAFREQQQGHLRIDHFFQKKGQ